MITTYEYGSLGGPTVTLPEEFSAEYSNNDRLRSIHLRLADLSLEQVLELMPRELRVESPNGDSMQFLMFGTHNGITPTADFTDVDTLAISGGQFGQDYDPGKWLMTEMSRAAVVPNSPLLYFPSPRLGQSKNIRLSGDSLQRVNNGDFGPIVDLRLRAIEDRKDIIGEPRNIFAFGHSQEASVGTQTALKISDGIARVALHSSEDPSLVEGRTPKQLNKDFQGDGLQELPSLFDAVRHSGIPALTEAQGIAPEMGKGFTAIRRRMAQDLGGLGFSQFMKVNKALHVGMANADNRSAINKIIKNEGKVVVTRAEASRILDQVSFEEVVAIAGVEGIVVREYGHEYYDNIVLAALVNSRAYELATAA